MPLVRSRDVQVSIGRYRRRSASLASLVLILAACGAAPSSPGSSDAGSAGPTIAPSLGSASATAPAGGVDTSVLTVGMSSIGSGEWAPARTGVEMQEVSKHLFSPLVRLNRETREYEGHLAESYSVSPDGTTWTFKLRPNIPFHDGWGTVTAQDVKYSWEQWIGPETNHGLGPTLSQAVDDDMANFEIVNDLEFRLHTTRPVVALDVALSDSGNGLQVVPQRYYEEKGAEALAHPIGTGPWKFVSYDLGVEMVMDAVKDHWAFPPAFDRLVLKEVADPAARLAQTQSGDLDIALLDSGLAGEAESAGLEIRALPDVANVFVILGGSYWGSEFLDVDSPWIQGDAPEKGKAIRDALSLAIDRQTILERVMHGLGTLSSGPIIQSENNPNLRDPAWKLPAFDPELAKQKLAEGGYPDGFPLKLFIYPRAIDIESAAEAVAGMWEDIGIQVERQPGEEGVLDELLNARDTNGMAWLKAAGLKGEVVSELRPYRSDKEDDHLFEHPAIDEAYAKVLSSPDREDRMAAGRSAIAAMIDGTYLVSLFTADLPVVVGPKVGSWDPVPGLDELTAFETVTPRN